VAVPNAHGRGAFSGPVAIAARADRPTATRRLNHRLTLSVRGMWST